MKRKLTVVQHHTLEELEVEIKRTRDGRYRLRLQAIYLAQEGKYKYEEIIEQLKISKKTFFKWKKWYNEEGLARIREVSLGGRKEGNPKWDNDIFDALYKKLDEMEEYWSVPKMREWIISEYKIKIPARTIQARVKKNGYSFKSSRPNPYKGDKEQQEAFKKKDF